ncbi:hypothetical protein [Rheinheimera sp. WS51]|uniref:hypothetical protein n=1 Tax=Rheinheimera sp. WS51 TaxID=3425886 RepID=UPI003D8F54D2
MRLVMFKTHKNTPLLKLTGFKPVVLNSASNRLTDECLVPLLSARMLKSAGYRLATMMIDEAEYLADG